MTEINSVTTLTRDGDIAIITLNSPPVNALSAKVREGLGRKQLQQIGIQLEAAQARAPRRPEQPGALKKVVTAVVA